MYGVPSNKMWAFNECPILGPVLVCSCVQSCVCVCVCMCVCVKGEEQYYRGKPAWVQAPSGHLRRQLKEDKSCSLGGPRFCLWCVCVCVCVNDTSDTKRAYITSTVLHVLQELRQAKQECDTPRVKALQTFLRESASWLVPFHLCGTIVVPNLTRPQKTVIANIVRKVSRASPLKAYERQALKHSVRTVSSNPHTVKSLFQAHAMRQSRQTTGPTCKCSTFVSRAGEFGKVLQIDGHRALLPTIFAVRECEGLRPTDPSRSWVPVPVLGSRARAQAMSGTTDFCKHLQAPVPPLDHLLPQSLFPESGNLLTQLSRLL